MSTFTIRVSSSATNPSGTAYGQQPDQGAPSYFDVVISGSSDPTLPNGVYDAYCLNPQVGIMVANDYSAQNYAGNIAASYVPIGFNSLSQPQVDQINWLLSQNLTSDGKYAGQFNFGEVQSAIWKLLDFSDTAIAATSQQFLNDNGRNVIASGDVSFLVDAARAAVASGNGVLPTDAFFSTIIDPSGNVQPLIIQLQSAKLGNFVWEDSNRNGVQDAGEAGVDRVVVELYDGSGNFIASTLTGDDFSTAAVEHGFYQFAGLKAGDYQVKFVAPSYAFTAQDVNGNATDAIDSDADALTGLSHIVSLAAGESNQTIDAGLVQKPGSAISGFVYCDTNNDGIKQAGEVGLGGVTVQLTGNDNQGNLVSASVVTNPDGSYSFNDLAAGTYTVTEVTQPADKLDGIDTAGTTPGSVAGNDVISNIVLTPGGTSTGNNFGEILPSKISGFVYEDFGNDGVRGAGEPAIGGVTVTLNGTNDLGNPVTATTTTNAAGFYEFLGLRPGTYSVTEAPQPGAYLDGKDTAGSTSGSVAGNDVISNIVLGAGTSSTDNNFGELVGAQIRGFVYCDDNNDGIKQGTEAGLGGVTVTLAGLDDLGNSVAATTTLGDGSYVFAGLRPGTYTVTEATQPADKLDGLDTAGFPANGVAGNEVISNIVLTQGLISSDNNFGEIKPAMLSGYVYEDAGNDGVRNNETPIAGVTVTLSGTNDLNQPVTLTTTTNAVGYYEFAGLRPGTYTVTETQPATYVDGKDTAGSTGGTAGNDVISDISLVSGANSTENNFGELPKAQINGFVYCDTNDDGIKQGTEVGLGGVTVTLSGQDDLGNAVTATTTTNPDGSYSFTDLRPGTYTVTETTQPDGKLDGRDAAGDTPGSVVGNDVISNIVLTPGLVSSGNNFGEILPSRISGYVYQDADNDGVRNNEAPIAGVTVTLTGINDQNQPVTLTTTTNAAGFYEFTSLRPGVYTVTETQPLGYVDGKDTAGTAGGTVSNDVISSIVLGPDTNSTENNFGELLPGSSVSGFVYCDDNNDGIKQAGELGLAGVTVRLTGTNDLGQPVDLSTTTGAGGAYTFDGLRPGTYAVTEMTQPADKLDGKDTAGSTPGSVAGEETITNIVLGAGEDSTDNNFGEILPGVVSGTVYCDTNNDGNRQPGEVGLGGVTVRLTGTDDRGNAVSLTTTSNPDGSYSFGNVRPGTYAVTEVTQPADKLDGKDTAGSTPGSVAGDEVISNIVLTPGSTSSGNNFGEILPSNVAGFVYCDTNNDGIKQAGDLGLPGVSVRLTGVDDLGQAVSLTTTTGADGSYNFSNLRPGTYAVTEVTQPADKLDGKDTAGTTPGSVAGEEVINNIVLGTGQTSSNNNFGELLPAKLSGYVYQDAGNDGVKSPGETGIAGVTVHLTGSDDKGTLVDLTTTTDANGLYQFTTLRPGTYTVTETQPAGFNDGKDTAGSAGGTAGNDVISNVVLGAGVDSVNNNFGELLKPTLARLGDFVWEDKNANGVQDLGEAGIAGVTVQLKDANGAVLQTTTTAANGSYGFDVAAGTYAVNVLAPNGYVATGRDLGGNDATDSDISANGQTGLYTVNAGDTNLSVDAGFYKAASIGDRIWYDKNANGIQDTGEGGIAGVTVELRSNGVNGVDGGTVLATTTTDANGKYLFSNLTAGDYHIDVVESTLPAGFVFTKANQGANDNVDSDVRSSATQPLVWGIMDNTTLAVGESDLSWDAGVYKVGIDVEKYVSSTKSTTSDSGGTEGESCSYWISKKLSSGWSGISGCTGNESFNQIFGCNIAGGTKSIYNVLCGTSTASADKMMRECVAAFLNACHDKVDYCYSKEQVVAHTKWAVDCGNYDDCRKSYEQENSKGCNWGDSKTKWDCVVSTDLYDADAPPGLEVKTGSTVTFTYIVKNTGDTALKNVTLTDDRIANVTYVSGDTDKDGLLDTNETWTFTATEVAQSGTIKNTGTVTAVDSVGGVATVTDKDDAYYTGTGALKSSLGDRVWEDANGNGVQDAGERGLSGVQVTLSGAGKDGVFGTADDITANTTTGVNGQYSFNNLDAGKYMVTFGTLAGYNLTAADQGSNDAKDSDANVSTRTTGVVTLGAGEQNLTVDAGMVAISKLGIDVEKYVSGTTTTTNNNGGSEGGSCSDWVSKCNTSSSWQWVSNGWFGGSWCEVKTPTGWGGVSGCTGKETFNQLFGCNIAGGTKSIYDVLCSTSTNSGDKMMRESVAAYLNACHDKVDYAYSKDQVLAQTKWAVDCGKYDDCSKAYEQENNKGCDWGSTKSNWSCVVAANLYDADAPPGLEVKTGSTVTFTYIVKNTGDTALKNIVLTDDRISDVTYVSGDTDKDGMLDVNETWTFTAKEVASAGTIKNTGTVTGTDSNGSGRTVTDQDDAYYTGTGAVKASLGDRVWEDKNGNGIQDKGEAGLAGVKVVLSGAGKDGVFGNADDVTYTTTTNANGLYEFNNLDAGKYVVTFQAGAGYVFTKSNQGSNDAIDSDVGSNGKTGIITLDANEHDLTVDAGLFRKACVGDKVWQDANHNNLQDAGEAGIGGITVKLLNDAGTVIATTKTDAAGKYLFSELDPGDYSVQFDKTNVSFAGANMSTWKWAVKDVGSNDAIDSDVTGDAKSTANVTVTSKFSLESGQSDMTRDAGITPIVIDLNGNGIHTVARADAQGTFDLFGNGKAVASGWLSGDDGFLAIDANGNGKIDGIHELFGGVNKGDGFAKLASFDSNGDGLVNDLDSAFGQLMIWRDANGNHSTDAGELMTLAQAGVASLNVGYIEAPQLDEQGNLHLERGVATMADGHSAAMTDVYFNVSADDAAAAGVTLPTMAELLGSDKSLDSLLGAAPQSLSTLVDNGDASAAHAGADASEALRRLAALSRESCSVAAAA